jgi:hypothetical protein
MKPGRNFDQSCANSPNRRQLLAGRGPVHSCWPCGDGVVGWDLKQGRTRLCAEDIRQLHYRAAEARIGALDQQGNLQVDRYPGFTNNLNGLLIPDRPGRDGPGGSRSRRRQTVDHLCSQILGLHIGRLVPFRVQLAVHMNGSPDGRHSRRVEHMGKARNGIEDRDDSFRASGGVFGPYAALTIAIHLDLFLPHNLVPIGEGVLVFGRLGSRSMARQ